MAQRNPDFYFSTNLLLYFLLISNHTINSYTAFI